MSNIENKKFKLLINSLVLTKPIAELTRLTGFSKSVISDVYNDKKEATENFLRILQSKITEQKEQAKSANNTLEEGSYMWQRNESKLKTDRKKSVPFYDVKATAGNVGADMTAISAPSGTIDVGDLLHDSESAIRIYGNSMLPNYPPGCVVGLVSITDSFIQPGEVYVIETTDGQRLLKRLFYKEDNADSDTFACYSDNIMLFIGGSRDGKIAYPPFNIKKKDVIKLFIVTGVIKRNTNSIIINRN